VTVIVHAVRAEDLQIDPANAVTARALAPLVELLALTHGFLEPGGVCVFPKGRNVDDELTTAAREWHMHVERHPSHTSADATLLRLSEIRRIN
jgi:16S rRNA (guanine527-N7)-methyltransferase